MKTIISIIFIVIGFAECKSQDSYAKLVGGYDSLYKTIKHETVLPDSCGNPGKVYVNYTITEEGVTDNIRVHKGICPYSDSVAVNIVRRLKFIPAKRNGVPVKIKQYMPIDFTKEE